MIQIKPFVFNPLSENTFVLFDETKEAIIIDPGCYEQAEKDALSSFVDEEGLNITHLLNTHCHIDHVLGNYYIKNKYNVPLYMHAKEVEVLKAVKVYAPNYGFSNYQEVEADHFVDEGGKIKFGNSILDIIFVPGHAPGHIAFYNQAENICMGDDVLFKGSIGRTDLPGGDFDTLIKSIREKVFPLGDEIVVYCGHGPETTVGAEKRYNPFL